MMHHHAAEAEHGAFLDRDQHLMLTGQPFHQSAIKRLGKARIGNRAGKPMRCQFISCLQAFLQARAIGQDGNRIAFAQHAALADFQH